MLANDFRRVTENIGDILKARPVTEKFRRQGVPEAMCVSVGDQRRLEHRRETSFRYALHGPFGRNPVPEEPARILSAATGQGHGVECRLQLGRDREEYRLATLFRAQEDAPASAILADAVPCKQRNVA